MNIFPRAKIIEPKQEILLPTQLAGRFRLQTYGPDGRPRKDTGWFPNLILDLGLNTIGSSANWLNACRVGTGNTAPANGQQNLIAHVAGTSTIQTSSSGAQGSEPYYGWSIKTFRFAQGAAAGNLAEVGIGTATADAANLFSRALILDGALDPTTLTVLSDEFLDVTYELRAYPPLVDGSYSIDISSVSYDITARAASVTGIFWAPAGFSGGTGGASNNCIAYSGAIGAITALPAGTSSAQTATNAVYSDSSYQRDFTATWGLNDANFGVGGITAFSTRMGCGVMQYGVSPGIPKDSTKTLAMTFRHTWARRP